MTSEIFLSCRQMFPRVNPPDQCSERKKGKILKFKSRELLMFTPLSWEELIAHFIIQAGNHESGTDIFSGFCSICPSAMPLSCSTFIVENDVRNHCWTSGLNLPSNLLVAFLKGRERDAPLMFQAKLLWIQDSIFLSM